VTSSLERPRRRADAERSIARIVAAARACLSENPDATIDDIAKAAGVGRMTLYGHFRSRAELVEAAFAEALRAGDEVMSSVDLSGDARDALTRLLTNAWELVAESSALLIAAEGTLPAGRIRDLHVSHAERAEKLVRRGQRQGAFRADLPLPWLNAAIYALLHQAADEIRAGRLAKSDAARVVTESVQSLLAAPRT
jgi:AcrR family transcriptional regulator